MIPDNRGCRKTGTWPQRAWQGGGSGSALANVSRQLDNPCRNSAVDSILQAAPGKTGLVFLKGIRGVKVNSRASRMKLWLISQLGRIGVDAPVFFSVLARAWQLLTGPVTMMLMTVYFTPEMRGYFYTFGSILALQVFFELSLHIVLINVSSHEWVKLGINEDGELDGDPAARSRLASLLRVSLRVYVLAAILFILLCGPGGAVFLARESLPSSVWGLPWIVLVILTGSLLAVQPLTAVLEGCDQLAVVNRYRFRQAVCGSLGVWVVIVSGFGLWAAAASAAVRLGWELHLVGVHYGRFFRSFRRTQQAEVIAWGDEVWPLQWRLAIQGIATWGTLQLLTPVIWTSHGDAEAGRMGMTWTVLVALQAAASSWVDTRRPKFGQLVATRSGGELNSLFFRCSLFSMIALAAGVALFCGVLILLPWLSVPIAQKLSDAFVSPQSAAILSLGILVYQIPNCQTIYVRAHKHEPFLVPSLIVSGCIAASVSILGIHYGVVGAAAGWTASVCLVQLPLWTRIWRKAYQEWDTDVPASQLNHSGSR